MGLDFSAGELEAARSRLLDVELIEGRAQSLPFEDDAFDLVVCHLAMMLFEDVESVLREVRRVLSEGGTLAVVVSRPETAAEACPPLAVWRQMLGSLTLNDVRIVDDRVRRELPRMLRDAGFATVDVHPFDLTADLRLAEAWAWLSESYTPERIVGEDLESLESMWRSAIEPFVRSDRVGLRRPLQEIVAR